MTDRIRDAVLSLKQRFRDDPASAVMDDFPAAAVLKGGLATVVEGPAGQRVSTDMPEMFGGGAAAPTPGWFLRAGVASCAVSVIAMRAAELGVALRRLEVRVASRTDERGSLGLDDSVPPGPFEMRLEVRVAADGVADAELAEIARWAVAHSPMVDVVNRAAPVEVDVAVA